MQGEYVVKIGDKTFEYTDANDITEKFGYLIKFVFKELIGITFTRRVMITLILLPLI